ncbi:MAG TPA: DUF6683 family protein [Kofleriaceae bacterium]|nr:DUF6683 family protein [Kofleriaceae bacterium]
MLLSLGLSSSTIVHAQSPTAAHAALLAPLPDAVTSPLAARILRDLRQPPAGGRTISTITAGGSDVTRRLADAYPAPQRERMRQMFDDLLAGYAKLETVLGIPHGDAAGAVALFVIASFETCRDRAVDSQAYAPVLQQLRRALGSHPAFVGATDAQRRELFEQLAALGMFIGAMRSELARDPEQAARLREITRAYLTQLLGSDPDALQIDTSGVVIAKRATPPPIPARARRDGSAATGAFAVAETIEGVGFYTVTKMGVGGYPYMVPEPIVLFRNGDALLDVAGLGDPGGLDAHRTAHPDEWTRWRRQDGKVERMTKRGWKALEWKKLIPRPPRGFTLEGHYAHLSGGGNVAVGGNVTIAVWRNYHFDRAGYFSSDGGGGSVSPGVTTSAQRAAAGGRYEIAGYTLVLRYDDGRVEQRGIVVDPKSTDTVWIDGTAYTK